MRRRSTWFGRAALAIGFVIALASCSSAPITVTRSEPSPTNPFRIGRPLVIPHGGGDGLFPENTLYAYEHSMAMGGDVIDADVQLTSDGIPIAFHDGTLDRTTDGVGSVRSRTYADLSTLDAGWGFSSDGQHPFRGRGITIPSIEDLLDAFPDSLVTLDLKDQRTEAVPPLCDLLRRAGRTGDVYIGVDTAEQVNRFRALCPEVWTWGTDEERRATRAARETNDPTFVTDQLVSQPRFIGSDGVARVTPESLAFSHRHDIAVLTWVVDDAGDMRELVEMGVDGIYTRRPDVLVDLLRSMDLM